MWFSRSHLVIHVLHLDFEVYHWLEASEAALEASALTSASVRVHPGPRLTVQRSGVVRAWWLCRIEVRVGVCGAARCRLVKDTAGVEVTLIQEVLVREKRAAVRQGCSGSQLFDASVMLTF